MPFLYIPPQTGTDDLKMVWLFGFFSVIIKVTIDERRASTPDSVSFRRFLTPPWRAQPACISKAKITRKIITLAVPWRFVGAKIQV